MICRAVSFLLMAALGGKAVAVELRGRNNLRELLLVGKFTLDACRARQDGASRTTLVGVGNFILLNFNTLRVKQTLSGRRW